MRNFVKQGYLMLAAMIIALFFTVSGTRAEDVVVGYSEINYQGSQIKWSIPKGYRHLLVESIPFPEGRVHSISIPGGLSAKWFMNPDFKGEPQVNSNQSGKVDIPSPWGVKSMIIYPDKPQGLQGVHILGRRTGQFNMPVGRFFPMPESLNISGMCFNDHTFLDSQMEKIFIHGSMMRVTLYSLVNCSGGEFITLGDAKKGLGPIDVYVDATKAPVSSMHKKMRSIRVETVAQSFNPGTILQTPSVVKTIEGKIIPGATTEPRLAGVWKSSINLVYEISQKEKKIFWKVKNQNQVGEFSLGGLELKGYYQDNPGNKINLNGRITQIHSTGQALRIKWENGVVFMRDPDLTAAAPAPTAPADQIDKIFRIDGDWVVGFNTYTIVQKGDSFTWTVSNSDEKGSGSIRGKIIDVKWHGSQGSGSAKGVVETYDSNRRVQKIVWDNNVIFSR